MKNKGISLIVLVVTIIVIIILAGAVILSLTQNNPIAEANEATFKNELKSLEEQAMLTVTSEYIKDNSIMTKKITESVELYKYMPSLKDSRYDGKVYIMNGNLTINASKFSREQIEWAVEAQISVGDLPVITDIELTSTETSVTIKAVMENTVGIIGYMYKISGIGTSDEWIENASNTYTFSGLKPGTEYIVQVKAKTNELDSISYMKTITTRGVSDLVSIVPSTSIWVNTEVTVTLSHSNIPSGYELQYKLETGEWTKYTAPVVVTSNTSIKGRLFNTSLNDEIGVASANISNIDKTNPSAPTDITVISTDINSITVKAIGSVDEESGIVGYEYSINGGAYSAATNNNQIFSSIKAGTVVTIKARAKDNVGLYSEEKTITKTTGNISSNVSIMQDKTAWTNANVIVTISHSNIPSGYELQYKLGTGEWTKYITSVVVSNNTDIKGRLYNISLDDEIGASVANITNIDKINPTSPILQITSGTVGNNGWYKSNVVVSVQNGTDNESKVQRTTYSISGAQNQGETTGNSVSITAEGISTITAFTYDNAGNKSVSAIITVKKDSIGPIFVGTADKTVTSNSISAITNGVSISDGVSDVTSSTSFDYTPKMSSLAYGINTITYTATDNAGNTTSVVRKITGNWGVCFVSGTKVSTPNGLINIEDLQAGDIVYSYNEKTNVVEAKEIIKTFVNEANIITTISFENGEKIKNTPAHPYYVVGKGWKETKDLLVGDYILTENGSNVRITDLNKNTVDMIKVYNFSVQDNQSYFVGYNKYLVHNTAGAGCGLEEYPID